MQKFSFLIIILIITSISFTETFGQKLDHVLGEVIIEVRDERGINLLMRDLSTESNFRSSLVTKQITSEPMNLWVIKTNPNEVNELLLFDKVSMHREVLQAQRNHLPTLRVIPNDPLFNNQWQFLNTGQNTGVFGADIDIDLAWEVTTGGVTTDGDTIVVCVIDDGVNSNHPDLGDNLWLNHQEIPNNDIDDDGNGYIDDYHGWSAYTEDGNVYVDGSHGTPVIGIVGAKGNNEIGVSGTLWDVKVMVVNGEGPEALALASYAYPYTMRKLYNDTNGEKGAFVVSTNSSWGTNFAFPEDAPIWCDFYNKLGEVGILNIAATTNTNSDVDVLGDLPTSCESDFLVSVTNMNIEDEKVPSAGFGKRSIDLGAYGFQVYTISETGYGNVSGTSFAAPHVAGTAALLYATDCADFMTLAKSDPALAALVAKDCILNGVKPNPTLFDLTTTGGGLNAYNAVENLVSTCGECTDAFGGSISDLTHESGILTWYSNGNEGTVSLRYKKVNEEDWIEVIDINSGFEFQNLTPCSTYEYQIKSICENNPNASYSYSKLMETNGCCIAPQEISTAIEGQSLTIEWEEVFFGTNYIVEWKLATEIIWNQEELGTNNSFVINNIQECDLYNVRIKTQCDLFSNESTFSEVYNIEVECGNCTQEYCSFSSKDHTEEWINSVEIVDVFTNVSGAIENGYSNFFDQFNIELTASETYSMVLTPGFMGSQYPEFFSVFIDLNQDGDMFDENETIYSSEFATMQAITTEFTVPQNAIGGSTRMRIIMRFAEVNESCDQNGFEFGEIEDYCVTILESTDCPNSFDSIVSDSTETSLTFELDEHPQIDAYIILYREKEMIEFDTVSSSTNQIVISDLIECSPYEYKSGFTCQGNLFIDSLIYEVKTKCELSTSNSDVNALNIYPNPSFGNLTIELKQPSKSEASIDLLSADGKYYQLNNKILLNNQYLNLETHSLPKGVYVVNIRFENYTLSKKWIKL